MSKTILITGAGSGFGRLVAFGLAERGHRVIATAQIWPQVTALRDEVRERKLSIEVDKLDVTSVLITQGPWIAGALVNNVWAGTGPRRVNQLTFNPFVYYNFPGGWYLLSAPS